MNTHPISASIAPAVTSVAQARAAYEAAIQDGLISDIFAVARTFGTRNTASLYEKYLWQSGELSIFADYYGNYATVSYKGKTVANTHYCEKWLVRGDWETIIRDMVRAYA